MSSNTVQTVFSLYELSMSVGKSLNYRTNCDYFMKALLSRKMLKAGWIIQLQNQNVRLRYAIPAPYKPEEEVSAQFIQSFLTKNEPTCIKVDQRISSICPIPVTGGYIVVFPMTQNSILFAHSPRNKALSREELRQLDPVMRKFGLSLEASSDFEEQKRLLKRLERNNKDLNDYAHVVSHDLKSPLRNIDGLINWMKEDLEENRLDEALKHMPLIHSSLEKMDSLIDGILRYSTLRDPVNSLDQVNLNTLVEEVLTTFLNRSEIEIQVDSLPIINANRMRLVQLYQNLIENAFSALGKKGGKIHIGFTQTPSHYEFFVSDNGPGIDKAYQEKIFQVFQKLDANSAKSGIGLAIVKRIVEDHGGQIRLESELGNGATFYFTNPK